jgi:beta-1,4-mannooligosaccharide/beta-1,4-mannosyl-N-acetylglucosamine phosphorylase
MTLRRHPASPILTREDIPAVVPELADPSAVFNPGAVEIAGRVRLLLRVQSRGRHTFLLPAASDDGVSFEVEPRLIAFPEIESAVSKVYHVYDPRITPIGDQLYVMLAVDTDDGCRLGTARTTDFADFEFLAFASDDDIRNGVLFPERREGRFLRLARPNDLRAPGEPATGDRIVLATSDDLIHWSRETTVLQGRPHYWDERIGSGPPPIRTRAGWLHLYHGVATHFGSASVYQAGAVLLDRDDPSRVVGRTRNNLLEPREPYELTGQVPNVVFPSGWVVRGLAGDAVADDDAEVLVYYGAADTSVGLATARIGELIEACRE